MGSKGSSSSSFTPPPEVVAAYKEALGYGRAAMGQQYQPYTGEITAPLTQTQESGITNVNRAVGTAIPYFGQATGLTADVAAQNIMPGQNAQINQAGTLTSGVAGQNITPQQFSQQALQPYMSPYTQYVADSTFRNLREQQRQEQESLQGQAIRAGAFGGDRAGIAAANMARQQDLATAQAMSNIYNQGYTQATGLFGQQQGVNLAADQANAARQLQAAQQLYGIGSGQQALGLQAEQANAARKLQAAQQLGTFGTGLQGSILQGAQAQLAAGAQQQAVQQAIASGYYNQYLAAQAYPYQQAQFFANLATGVGGQMGGTTTGTPAQPSPVGSIFGALGAIGSIMSDKRAKENIKPIGKTNDGQTIYRFNYKGDNVTQIGLLAQEVEKKHPEAIRTINGLKGVDYKEATDDSVRSMGGGVVPSSTRKDFAAGGSLDTEEDPMIPYKAGVPARVLQIPKLARIGGNKPNFGGEPPKQPGTGGVDPSQMKGAAAGLGKIYDKLTTPSAAESGAKIVAGHEDFMDMMKGLSFALGGAAAARRRRFADGDEVPVTEDTIPVSEDKPIQVASLGDAARVIDAGVPSAEPIREPARNVEPGVVPSMARANADLPPMFSGREEAPAPQQVAAAEPTSKPVSVPSMARTDANVPEVKPGLEPAKTRASAESNPILDMIRAEAERQGVPFEIAKQIAGAESRFNPNAQAKTSSAGGVYQIIDSTMRGLGGDPSQKYDPAQNIKYGVKYIAQNYNALTSPDDPDAAAKVYMGHFFGTGGAKNILSNPDRPISETLPNYRQAVASNAGIKSPSGVPIAEWTGRDAQEWAAAKMAGNYEPRGEGQGRVRVAEAGLGAGKTATDAGDRKWNFGMAGDGKRSIIESIMDRDFDPIQKRALFSFFAGMAASPSPWFGQQLGAGMQAASNVYNESMNKQNELDIRKQQLGMEQQRIGISERLADVQEKTKAIEALKFWQSRFKQIPTPEGFSYLDTTTGQTISQDEYNAQMANVMKQYKLTPAEAGSAVAKPGLAPAAGAAAPAGGLVPQPKPELPAIPERQAAPTATTPSIPKPTEVPSRTEATKPTEAPARTETQAPKRPAEADMYADIRDDYNPIMLRDKAAEQRRIAANAQKLGDLAGAKAANDLADSYSKKAVDITENKVPVVFKDGTVGRIPQIEKEALRTESAKEAQKINVTENTKWMNEQADAQVRRDLLMSRTNELANILETYETGRFAEQKANLVASLRAMGINVPATATSDPAKFEQFVKNQINNVFDEVKSIGGQVRVAEIQGLQQAQAGPGMQPEANRAILGYTRGLLNWENKKFDDSVDAIKNQGINQFNRSEWMREWSKQNSLDKYIKEGKKSIAAMGATPQDPSDLEEGQHYILKKGQFGVANDGKYVFKTRQKDGVTEGAMIPVR